MASVVVHLKDQTERTIAEAESAEWVHRRVDDGFEQVLVCGDAQGNEVSWFRKGEIVGFRVADRDGE